MNEPLYFVCWAEKDGTHIHVRTYEELLTALTPDASGETAFGKALIFLDHVPPSEKGFWILREHEVLIIRGEIVMPRPVRYVVP